MAQATTAQYETAIANFRRQASEHRIRASREVEGSWQQRADLRCAAHADAQADDLVKQLVLRQEQALRIQNMR